MSSGLAGRVSKLHAGSVSDVSSEIIIMQQEQVLRRVWRGTNPNKVIRIVVKL